MTNRQRRLVLLLLIAVLTLQVESAMAGTNIPFKGSDVGTFAVPGLCADGSANVVIGGEGTATHLGHYSYAANECFNPATGAFSGVATFTAANGDELWGSYSGEVAPTADPDVITYIETLNLTGGNGRFAGASGELLVDGEANLATGGYVQSLRGWISNLGLAHTA